MPGREEARAVGMEECEGGREVGIVVNYVGEVGHGLSAFVHRGCEGSIGRIGGGVDGVNRRLPAVRSISKIICQRRSKAAHTLANVLLPSPYSPSPSWP